MLYKKLCAIVLMSALVISSACVTAFAAKEEEVVEETEGMLMEGYVQKIYDNFADFKADVMSGKLEQYLKKGDFTVKLTNKVYLLQTKKSVSTLKFNYRDRQAGKTTKETLKLQQIVCGPDHVTFRYDNGIYFIYYPDYRSEGSANATKQMYNTAKKNAIQSKVINKHRVYVNEHKTYRSELTYEYTWVEDGCLFTISVPKEKGINYGFTLLKLKQEHTFEQKDLSKYKVTPLGVAQFEAYMSTIDPEYAKLIREDPELAYMMQMEYYWEDGSVEEVAEIDVLYPAYTSAELAKNSSNIVVGTVQSIEPNYSNSGDYYSRVKIAVKENLKGTVSNQTISIPMFGGIKDGVAHRYEGAPAYMVGEEVLLYLNPFSSAGKNWYIPITFDATLNLNPPVNRQAIIAQVREDIEVSELEKTFAEGTTVGEPVEDIMLDWE